MTQKYRTEEERREGARSRARQSYARRREQLSKEARERYQAKKGVKPQEPKLTPLRGNIVVCIVSDPDESGGFPPDARMPGYSFQALLDSGYCTRNMIVEIPSMAIKCRVDGAMYNPQRLVEL